MSDSTFGLGAKNDLKSSEYYDLFGDPFGGEAGSLEARRIYAQLNEKEKALMLKANYIKMIEKSRQRNYDMAADCLQWWLDGSGSTKNIDFHWLRKQRELIASENVNIERFENDQDSKFGIFLLTLEEMKTKRFSTYYEKQVKGGVFGELYYASGDSTLSSRCYFNVIKQKNNFTLSGTIIHSWNDRYDWHKGAFAFIFGFGFAKDSDALLVEKYCGAKPFEMRSQWQQTFNTTFKDGISNRKLR